MVALALLSEVRLITSEPILRELHRVLTREKFAQRLASVAKSPDRFAADFASSAVIVGVPEVGRLVPWDPDDDVVLATGLAASADVIVTGDRDLLRLHPFRAIRILRAADTLAYVRAQLGGGRTA